MGGVFIQIDPSLLYHFLVIPFPSLPSMTSFLMTPKYIPEPSYQPGRNEEKVPHFLVENEIFILQDGLK